MNPILFPSTAETFTTKGLGVISDAISCKVHEQRNGIYELEMSYPVSGKRYRDLAKRNIIFAKPNNSKPPQAFRIYRITKPMSGKVSVYAEHISYDLNGIPVLPFTAGSADEAMRKLKSQSAVTNPFSFDTDVTTQAQMTLAAPAAIKGILFNKEGSVIDTFGGEWEFDNIACILHRQRGADNGVQIRYGKNLVTLEQDEKVSNVYTGVLPYYYSENDGEIHAGIVNVTGTFDYVRILPLDLSDKFEEKPNEAQLQAEARAYIQRNDIGVPDVSLSISFVELSKAAGYENIATLETVNLCDTVTVIFEKLGIRTTAKVVDTVYDVLKERYEKISVGSIKESIADTIATQNAKLNQTPTKDFMEKAISYATELITGNRGGYVILHDSDGSGNPDEILIMDTDNISTAQQVWRWNKEGLGYSNNGYAGPYGTAITIDGTILGNYLKVNTVEANKIVNHSIDDTQVRTGGISVSGSGQGSGTGGGVLAPYTIGSLNIGSGAVGSGQCDGYINGGVAEGYYAASVFAGSVYASYIGANVIRASTQFMFRNQGVSVITHEGHGFLGVY